ncbi:hypothetical protein RJ639_044920 [Escallonia herrerae]|uniref:NAC domain-containing protein n=1 Tax=Escallonia herrerae TaxID=1293975 RepID=A0AA89B2N2_9ASTE|nr:hypothetical protein RJ639_044920 [Escallonia herrerae]
MIPRHCSIWVFHPTDEELVGFYLKKKIQQRPLSIELIKQLDIYKYDPWDLPTEMATTGEREWYFYCPRDRKYRNSARPNRVTAAGFWKATGTDRPIFIEGCIASAEEIPRLLQSRGFGRPRELTDPSTLGEGCKCIGLKKSLVFYKGRAAKGIKTDWMMHEFRLPSLADSVPPKRFLDKNIPANDSWAICRIFKKANSTTQRTLSHSWVSPLPETSTYEILNQHANSTTQFSTSDRISLTTKASSVVQYGVNNDSIASFSPLDVSPYKPFNPIATSTRMPSQVSISNTGDILTGYTFLSPEPTNCTADASSLLLNMSSSMLGDFGNKALGSLHYGGLVHDQYNGFSITLPEGIRENVGQGEESALVKDDANVPQFEDQWGIPSSLTDFWKSNFLCDSSPCPSEMSTSYSTNKCYT